MIRPSRERPNASLKKAVASQWNGSPKGEGMASAAALVAVIWDPSTDQTHGQKVSQPKKITKHRRVLRVHNDVSREHSAHLRRDHQVPPSAGLSHSGGHSMELSALPVDQQDDEYLPLSNICQNCVHLSKHPYLFQAGDQPWSGVRYSDYRLERMERDSARLSSTDIRQGSRVRRINRGVSFPH